MAKFDSELEKNFSILLDQLKIKWVNQYVLQLNNNCKKKYDFFLYELNILVEIDGNFWHNNVQEGYILDKWWKKKNFKNDALKNVLATSHGFKILRIWETELKEMTPEILLEKIEKLKQ